METGYSISKNTIRIISDPSANVQNVNIASSIIIISLMIVRLYGNIAWTVSGQAMIWIVIAINKKMRS